MMFLPPLLIIFAAFFLGRVNNQELDIIGKNSMTYDPINNLPYPCKAPKLSKKGYVEFASKDSRTENQLPGEQHLNKRDAQGSSIRLEGNRLNLNTYGLLRGLMKRGALPIKLQPCPFPNQTQEHRWLKTFRRKRFLNSIGMDSRDYKKGNVLKKLLKTGKSYEKRNDVIRKLSKAEEVIRGQLYGGTDINTGYGGVSLTGASLSVINILPYVHVFDTQTGMPYVCDPYKKKVDKKIDHRWNMIVPPCPNFKKCLFPWNKSKACKTKVDNNSPVTNKRRWVVKPDVQPVMAPV